MSLRALFRVQSGTSPSNPYPNELAEGCACGGVRTSWQHLLQDCPLLATARNDFFPPTEPDPDPAIQAPATPDPSIDETRLPALITFFRRIGLGFGKEVRDRCAEDGSDVDDLDVGPIGSPAPDPDL